MSRTLDRTTSQGHAVPVEGKTAACFRIIESHLCTAPMLTHPDWTLPFLLQTDASDYAVAAILAQDSPSRGECVICYASKTLGDGKRFWDVREKELYAVIYGCEPFHKYLAGSHFNVQTDHRNLKWLMSNQKSSGRLARWTYRLQPYDFEIQHRPGRANANADALSRLPGRSSGQVLAIADVPNKDSLLD